MNPRMMICVVITGFGIPWIALAGPPFVTDDPEPVDYRHGELYFASQNTKDARGWTGTSPHGELNYGVIPDLQLHAILPMAYASPEDGAAHYGLGDVECGVKWRFMQESDDVPQVGVFPMVEAPTGEETEGLGNGKMQVFLPLWLQKRLGDWITYGGGGYGINPGDGHKNWVFGGLVVQRQLTRNTLLGVETYHRSATETGGQGDTAFNIGAVFDLTEQHHLLFSAGRSIDGSTKFQTYLAYQLTFGTAGVGSSGGDVQP